MKYVKKPVVVEAFQFGVDEFPDWFIRKHGFYIFSDTTYGEIITSEDVTRFYKGDYIIREINGKAYPCKEDIFKATYDVLEEI